jgi:hypothetical protein
MGEGIKKIIETMKDDAFCKELGNAGSKEEVIAMLKDKVNGLTDKELDEFLDTDIEMTEEELMAVAGGETKKKSGGKGPSGDGEAAINDTIQKIKILIR